MELAREEMSSYKQMLQSSQKKMPVDLNVSVLSASAWPTYPDLTVEVPRDIQVATADFEQHYKMKHSGRRLAWKHALAHCQLKASFPKGNKEIVVSSFQAVVMLYFNDKAADEAVGYTELKAATSLSKFPGPGNPGRILTNAPQATKNSNGPYNPSPAPDTAS